MKFKEFSYEVRVEVEISLTEVELLRKLAQAHYDYTCKAAAKEGEKLSLDECADVVDSERAAAERGGFLWGWRNMVMDPEPMLVCMTSRQVNLCCKILEIVSYFEPSHPHYEAGNELAGTMSKLFRKLADESNRCNLPGTEPAPPGFTPPECLKPLLEMLDNLVGFRDEGGTLGCGPILRLYEGIPSQVKAWGRD